jgi:Fis family transcriptional regulator
MSKDNIQDVVKKSLEKYFRDLGEQEPSNVYEMVIFTVEKPILEAVMDRAEGNQSHAADMLGINTACSDFFRPTSEARSPRSDFASLVDFLSGKT